MPAVAEVVMRLYILYAALLVCSASLLAAAPAPEKKDPTKEDQEKIQGTWQVESAELGGEKAPAGVLKTQLIFSGEKLVSKKPDYKKDCTFKLDAAAKVKTIDIRTDNQLFQGIYKLDGDTLTICLDEPGKARPSEFESKEGSHQTFVILKRVKP